MLIDDASVGMKIDYMLRTGGYVTSDLLNITGYLISNPPVGKQKITNIYYDSSIGSIVAEVQA